MCHAYSRTLSASLQECKVSVTLQFHGSALCPQAPHRSKAKQYSKSIYVGQPCSIGTIRSTVARIAVRQRQHMHIRPGGTQDTDAAAHARHGTCSKYRTCPTQQKTHRGAHQCAWMLCHTMCKGCNALKQQCAKRTRQTSTFTSPYKTCLKALLLPKRKVVVRATGLHP